MTSKVLVKPLFLKVHFTFVSIFAITLCETQLSAEDRSLSLQFWSILVTRHLKSANLYFFDTDT